MDARDMHTDFGRIYDNRSAFVNDLLEIQKCQKPRTDPGFWASHLRFLNVAELDEIGEIKWIMLESKQENSGRKEYIALSYRWSEEELNPRYHIVDGDSCRRNRVDNLVLDRAIRYASSENIPFIWIDQECMDQEDGSNEKAIGIESMDLVYRRSRHPVGLLSCELSFIELSIVRKFLGEFGQRQEKRKNLQLLKSRPQDTILRLLVVLGHILDDHWWQRAWIYQEEFCSPQMNLLIPCRHADDVTFDEPISAIEFRTAVTQFCLAAQDQGFQCQHLMHRAKRYNILNEQFGSNALECRVYTSYTKDVLRELEGRENRDVFDKLAIISNCCNYSVRLDGRRLAAGNRFGLSVCILALLLLNGEVLRNCRNRARNEEGRRYTVINKTICEIWDEYGLQSIPISWDDKHLTFLKRCRLPNVRLTAEGIESEGWIWELGAKIDIQLPSNWVNFNRKCSPLNTGHIRILKDVSEELWRILGQNRVTERLQGIIEADEDLRCRRQDDANPSYDFQVRMVEAIVHALDTGKEVRMARLLGQRDVRGLFVCNERRENSLVFTAWSREQDLGPEKYVSLEVLQDYRFPSRHEVREWMNGLWFATRGEGYGRVTFSWPL